jgi:hypothetical protein
VSCREVVFVDEAWRSAELCCRPRGHRRPRSPASPHYEADFPLGRFPDMRTNRVALAEGWPECFSVSDAPDVLFGACPVLRCDVRRACYGASPTGTSGMLRGATRVNVMGHPACRADRGLWARRERLQRRRSVRLADEQGRSRPGNRLRSRKSARQSLSNWASARGPRIAGPSLPSGAGS